MSVEILLEFLGVFTCASVFLCACCVVLSFFCPFTTILLLVFLPFLIPVFLVYVIFGLPLSLVVVFAIVALASVCFCLFYFGYIDCNICVNFDVDVELDKKKKSRSARKKKIFPKVSTQVGVNVMNAKVRTASSEGNNETESEESRIDDQDEDNHEVSENQSEEIIRISIRDSNNNHEDVPRDFDEINDNELNLNSDEILGIGGFGIVRKGVWSVRRNVEFEVAVKSIKMDKLEESSENVIEEFKNQLSLKHPNVVKVYGYSYPMSLGVIRIVMEKMDMNILSYVKECNPSLSEKIWIMEEMVKSVHFLHHQRPVVIHRDIKSLNFLISNRSEVKISDFGLMTTKNEARRTSGTNIKGTPAFLSPEVFDKVMLDEGERSKNDKEDNYSIYSDIYALGITFWEVLYEKNAYQGLETMAIVFQVCSRGLRPSFEDPKFPDEFFELKELVEQMWQKEPKKRPDTEFLKLWFGEKGKELKESGENRRFP